MTDVIRIVHYVNQFFGGLGSEDHADAAPHIKEEPVGPGRGIAQQLGARGQVVATIICGDNYYAEHLEQTQKFVLEAIRKYKPDLFLAGPAFNAGRYGMASGELCAIVQEKLNIPAVTAMFDENPGKDLFHKRVHIIRTDDSVRSMNDALKNMTSLGLKLVQGEKIGRPADEGYFPRGIVVNEPVEETAAKRAVDMVLDKIHDRSYTPELETPKFEHIAPALPVEDMSTATIALLTDGGLVPKGNPDKMEAHRSVRFATYSIEDLDTLDADNFQANHMGYDNSSVDEDPNRLVPLDALRQLEKEKQIGRIYKNVITTAGVATTLDNSQRIGEEIAAFLVSESVDGAILTST